MNVANKFKAEFTVDGVARSLRSTLIDPTTGDIVAEACYHALPRARLHAAIGELFDIADEQFILPPGVPPGHVLVLHIFKAQRCCRGRAAIIEFLDAALEHPWTSCCKSALIYTDWAAPAYLAAALRLDTRWDYDAESHCYSTRRAAVPTEGMSNLQTKMLVYRDIDAMEPGSVLSFGTLVGMGFITKLVLPALKNLRWPYAIFEHAGVRRTQVVPSRKLFTELSHILANPDRAKKPTTILRLPTDWRANLS